MPADISGPFVATVVIPCYNVADTVAEQLDALSRQPLAHRLQVIVSDNLSTDETQQVVRSRDWGFGELRVVEARASQTVAHARNVGIAATESPLVLVCDGDDRVGPGWVQGMLDALARFDLVAGQLLPWDPVSGEVMYPTPERDSLPRWYGFLPSAVGASIGFRRTVWEAVEGFDESLSIGAEDTDFCWRAQLAGFTLGAARDATVYYRVAPTASLRFRKRFRDARSQVVLYRQFRPLGMPPVAATTVLRRWASLVVRIFTIGSRARRLQWCGDLGHAVGRAVASARYSVWYP